MKTIFLIGLTVVGVLAERIIPAASCPIRGVLINITCFIPATILRVIKTFAVAGGVFMITNILGGGLIIREHPAGTALSA
jgi:hypothetical protein